MPMLAVMVTFVRMPVRGLVVMFALALQFFWPDKL
jgi:hypothetical protein